MRKSLRNHSLLVLSLLLLPLFFTPQMIQQREHPQVHFAPGPNPSMPLPSPIPVGSLSLSPVQGVLRVLVIAAAFPNVNSTVTITDLKQAFFGTVSNYYSEVSYGEVKLQGDVFGWYRLPYPEEYYGKDCAAIDDTDCSGQNASWQLARDAATAAQKDVGFNNYDYYVFIHSGFGEESSAVKNDVWSVTYLGGIYVPTKTKTLMKFAIVPELEARGANPIGVYAHEFAHLLGLPDLYNTGSGRSIIGPWSLMDKGLWNGRPPGTSPAHLDAWSKIKLGWINGSYLGMASAGAISNFTIQPTETTSSGVHAVEVPISTNSPPTKYYLVEVRQHVGFDSALPAAGVLITYVDERAFYGVVTVIDGHPRIPGLTNATWTVGQTFSDERNNIAISILGESGSSFQVSVERRSPMPDLRVGRIFTQPEVVTPNKTVTINIEISNQGTMSASNVPIQIYLDNIVLANEQVSVSAGSTNTISVTWASVAGSHVVKVVIDPQDQLQELNKGNNIYTQNIMVGPTLIITVPLNISSNNASAWVIVNGNKYFTNNASQVRTSVASGRVTVEVESSIEMSTGIRQAFLRWSDGVTQNPRQMNVTSDTSLNAVFQTQYLVSVDPNHGITSSSGWYDVNSTVTIAATSPSNVTGGRRLIFTNWSGDVNSNSSTVNVSVSKPVNVIANWKAQYFVNLDSAIGTPTGGGWYDSGNIATVSVQTPVEFSNVTRAVFTGWNGTIANATTTFSVSSPVYLKAFWRTQYMVQVESSYGNPQGAGWYDAGTSAQVSVAPNVDYANRTRRIFSAWQGDYSGTNTSVTLQVNSPKSLIADWVTEYQLTFRVEGIPNSTFVKLAVQNTTHDVSVGNYYQGWFKRGETISPSVNQTLLMTVYVYRFSGWRNATGSSIGVPFTVLGPQDFVASYASEFILPPIPGFPVESILVGILLGLLALTFIRRRRRIN